MRSAGDAVVATVTVAGLLVPAAATGALVARAAVRSWPAAARTLVAAVVAVAELVVVGELLGTLGLFSRWPLALAGWPVVAVTAVLVRRGASSDADAVPPREAQLGGRPVIALCAAAVAAVALQWGGSAWHVLNHGVTAADALNYHLTHAARFVQLHATDHIQQVASGDGTAYYPSNDELLHAELMTSTRDESPALVIGLLAGAFTLLAAWVAGAGARLGPLAVAAVVPLLATPLSGRQYAGSAENDWTAVGLLLAGVAIWLQSRRQPPRGAWGPALVGLALGLAIGTKLSIAAPAVLLTLVTIATVGRTGRWSRSIALVGAGIVTGGYWFVRTWVRTGSPLPTVSLGPLPRSYTPFLDSESQNVAQYLTNHHVLHAYLVPGLRTFFGPRVWVVFLVVPVLLVLAAVARGTVVHRALAVIATLAAIAYLVTPTGAAGAKDEPVLFVYNIRYAYGALVLAVIAGVLLVATERVALAAALLATILTFATLAPRAAWASSHGRYLLVVAAVIGIAVGFGAALLTRAGGEHEARRAGPVVLRAAAAIAVIAVLGAAGYAVDRRYEHRRYRHPADAREALFAAGAHLRGATVAVVGLPYEFPFYGDDLRNRVTYVAQPGARHAYVDYTSCSAWRAALRAGGFDYIATLRTPLPVAAEGWEHDDPAVTPVLTNDAGSLFRVTAPVTAAGCTS